MCFYATNGSFCVVPSVMDNFWSVAGGCWELSIAIHNFRVIVMMRKPILNKNSLLKNHWLVWSFSALMASLPATDHFYVGICNGSPSRSLDAWAFGVKYVSFLI